jgi:hypothetical protein
MNEKLAIKTSVEYSLIRNDLNFLIPPYTHNSRHTNLKLDGKLTPTTNRTKLASKHASDYKTYDRRSKPSCQNLNYYMYTSSLPLHVSDQAHPSY